MTKDRSTGLIALVLGCAVAYLTAQLPKSSMAGDIGPKVFPYISAGLLMLCGLGLLITGKKKEECPYYTLAELVHLGKILSVIVGYCVLLYAIGYIIATILGTFVLSFMFGRKENIQWYKSLLFAVVLTALMYYIFAKVFVLPLPRGLIF